ncbi:MAG TPA: ABC transporter permease [Cyclobacteriaceae bacterium]|nr:ABC transporter permease [Cyclobacteriaceae bacterium]
MLKNYFVVALRHLVRHKLFSVLNIFCLAIGITLTMLIGAYVVTEQNVNASLRNIDQQYHIKSKWKSENMGMEIITFSPLAKTLKEEYPHLIENYYRFDPARAIVSVDDKHFRVGIAIGDTTFPSMYGFELVHGDQDTPFLNDQSAVVTESFAMQFFGRKDIVNEVISIQTPRDGRIIDFTVTGVLGELPYNNSITNFTGRPYQVFIPMHNNQYFQPDGDKGDNWNNTNMVNMVELKKGISPAEVETALAQLLGKYQPLHTRGKIEAQLEDVKGYYLKKDNEAVGKMIVTLLSIAAFILLMTIINFVNIHIGTSSYRLKEIGLRKVFGGLKLQIVSQHLLEALILTCISLLLSLVAYELLSPIFSQLLGTRMDPVWKFSVDNWPFLVFVVLIVSILSGVYPAFTLSSLSIIQAAKGKLSSIGGRTSLRKGLLITQFSLAIITFICALTISRQVSYFFDKDLGYSKEQLLVVSSLPRQWDSTGVVKMESIKEELLQTPNVKAATLSYDIPDGAFLSYGNVYPQGSDNFVSMLTMSGDADFAEVFGLTMIEGTFLKPENGNNVRGRVVLNEAAVKALGWTSAVGETIRLQSNGADYSLTVAGVVKDFHYGSMQATVQPLLFADVNEPYARVYRYFSIKVGTSDLSTTINDLKKKCGMLLPESGFEYTFMDDRFQSMYTSELQLKTASDIATILMLVIMLLGIFGIVSFSLSSRTREIAIRKVVGAKAINIVMLFAKDYAKQILIANIIAWPLAFVISNYWLQSYAYRVDQNITPFISAAGTMLTAAFMLIAVQCYKAAVANPVKDLKSE